MTSQLSSATGNHIERFMASGYGRLARLALGATLVAVGLGLIRGPLGLAVAAFALAPIASGTFNICPVAPLWGGQFLGSRCAAGKSDGDGLPR